MIIKKLAYILFVSLLIQLFFIYSGELRVLKSVLEYFVEEGDDLFSTLQNSIGFMFGAFMGWLYAFTVCKIFSQAKWKATGLGVCIYIFGIALLNMLAQLTPWEIFWVAYLSDPHITMLWAYVLFTFLLSTTREKSIVDENTI